MANPYSYTSANWAAGPYAQAMNTLYTAPTTTTPATGLPTGTTSNPLDVWNATGGKFTARTGADAFANQNTATSTFTGNFTPTFNYQNPMWLNDTEGANMRMGGPFSTGWNSQTFQFDPNNQMHKQWATSTDKFGGMWKPTDQADIAAGQGADANTAYRKWFNNWSQANPTQFQDYQKTTGADYLKKTYGTSDVFEAWNRSGGQQGSFGNNFIDFYNAYGGGGGGADTYRALGLNPADPNSQATIQALNKSGAQVQFKDGKISVVQPGAGQGEQMNPYMNQGGQQPNQLNQYLSSLGGGPGLVSNSIGSVGQPWQVNPYLAQQAAGMATSAINDFQRTIAPGLRSGAMAAGGYGGSRQGIAEGIAVGDLQKNILNATANLFGQAYEGDQNRATTRYGVDVGATTAMRGQDKSLEGTKYSADTGYKTAQLNDATNRYLGQLQSSTTMRGQDINRDLGFAGLDTQRYLGDQSNQTTRRGQDVTRELGYIQDGTNRYLGGLQNDTTRRGQDLNFSLGTDRLALDRRIGDQNYGLGLQGLGIQQQNANTNRLGVENQYALGMYLGGLQNDTTRRGQDLTFDLGNRRLTLDGRVADQNYGLGLGSLGIQQQNANTNRLGVDNQYALGMGNLGLGWAQQGTNQFNADTSRLGVNNSYALGLGNLGVAQGQLALGNRVADNNLTLGQGQLNLGWANNALGQGQLDVSRAVAGTGAATAGANMTTNALTTATGALQALYQMGITDMNNPLMQFLMPYITTLMGTATGGTSTTKKD